MILQRGIFMVSKLYGPDGKTLCPDSLVADRNTAPKIGCVYLGEQGIYFRRGMKNCGIAYSVLERAFERVRDLKTNVCCGPIHMDVTSLVLCVDGRETDELNMEKESDIEQILRLLPEKNPAIAIGVAKKG
jgi:hypothetical protein